MRVLLDMDGVLANFCEGFRRHWVERLELPDYFTNWDTWDLYAFVPEKHHLLINSIMCVPGFFGDLPVMPGAAEAVDEIVAAGHDVFICSTPWDGNDRCVQEKLEWLRRHFGKAIAKKAIFSHDKTLIHGEVLVDDKPEIVGAHTPAWSQVVYHWPYNSHVQDKPRLNSWSDWRSVLRPREP